MSTGAEVSTPGRGAALRYGIATSALVLAVCAVLAIVAGTALASAQDRLGALTARTSGTIIAIDGDHVMLRWTPAGAGERTDVVPLVGRPPPVGTRTEVAYDPASADRPLVPGAAELAAADSRLTVLFLAATVAGLVLVTAGWHVCSRRRAAARPGRRAEVRRVRIDTGLIGRSWLETESVPRRWIPVHFDPVLLALPSPATVRVHGDPLHDRLVAVDVDGALLHASGPVRDREPRGRRRDNPSRPDASARERAARLAPLRRRLLADLPLVLPAPVVAALWTYVDGGGPTTWIATCILIGAVGPWLGAMRGSDPS